MWFNDSSTQNKGDIGSKEKLTHGKDEWTNEWKWFPDPSTPTMYNYRA